MITYFLPFIVWRAWAALICQAYSAWDRTRQGEYEALRPPPTGRRNQMRGAVQIDGNLARRLARYSLWLWGDTIAARMPDAERRVIVGNWNKDAPAENPRIGRSSQIGRNVVAYPGMARDEDAPCDDPNEALFWYAQVERVLSDIASETRPQNAEADWVSPYRSLAFHRYLARKPLDAFPEGITLDRELNRRLYMCFELTWGAKVPQSVIREAFARINSERVDSQREGNRQRMATKREEHRSESERDLRHVGAESQAMQRRRRVA